jgi:Protein of unknown function (DUF3102)
MTNVPSKLDNKYKDTKAAELMTHQAKTTAGIIGMGRVLTEVKEALPHGEYTEWMKKHFPFSNATSLNYRRSFAFATSTSDFAGVKLENMAMYFCADLHNEIAKPIHKDHDRLMILQAGLKAIVKAARKRLITEEDARHIFLETGSAIETEASKARHAKSQARFEAGAAAAPPLGVFAGNDIEVAETAEVDDDDSTLIADEEDENVADIVAADITLAGSDNPPLSYIHETPDGELIQYLPASPQHFQTALHAMLATHAKTSDDEWLKEIEINPVEFNRLLDHLNDLRGKRDAGNNPIKTKADRAEAKAKR